MTTLLTNSGIDVRPGELDPSTVRIDDIAHALSLRCRLLGHTRIHYSVAQHSLLVARILEDMGAPRGAILCGLMHDAHEAYVGSVPASIKTVLGAAWADVEQQAEAAVLVATGLTHTMMDWRDLIRHVDRIALATERRDLMRFDADSNRAWLLLAGIEPHPQPATDGGWSPRWWEDQFLEQFDRLGGVQIHPVHAAIFRPTRKGVTAL